MKKEQTEELFVKWVDGCLSKEEQHQLDEMLAAEPELKAELAEARKTSELLKSEVSGSVDPPYPDFFNSQLMRKVDIEIASRRPAERAARWWESLRWAWAPAGGLALVLAFFAGQRLAPGGKSELALNPQTEVKTQKEAIPNVYFAEKSLSAEIISNSDGEVSAIIVDGIAAIKDDVDFWRAERTSSLPKGYLLAEKRRFH